MHHNGEYTRKDFKSEKRTHQGDPISAHLFDSRKETKDIHNLNLFEHTFLPTAYPDNTTFFLRRQRIRKRAIECFQYFHNILWFKS